MKTTIKQLTDSYGLNLSSVTWGYQEIFRDTLEELVQLGIIGTDRPVITHTVFEVLQKADKSVFDSVIKAYLDTLRSPQRWIVRTPQLFERWTHMGLRLGEKAHFLGIRFFQATTEAALGTTPKQMDFCLDMITLVIEQKKQLLTAFMQGFAYLRDRLQPDDIRKFVIDVSGSTGDVPDTAKSTANAATPTVLDIEKRAAFVLAAGLDALQDPFGLFDFTGTGRENCVFYVFKEFDGDWNREAQNRLFGVSPGSSTRIGAALRHAGWKLQNQAAKLDSFCSSATASPATRAMTRNPTMPSAMSAKPVKNCVGTMFIPFASPPPRTHRRTWRRCSPIIVT